VRRRSREPIGPWLAMCGAADDGRLAKCAYRGRANLAADRKREAHAARTIHAPRTRSNYPCLEWEAGVPGSRQAALEQQVSHVHLERTGEQIPSLCGDAVVRTLAEALV
jgi:hypothetical protein